MTKHDDRSRENDRNHRSNSTQPREVRAEDVAPPGAVPDTPSVHRESAKDMVVNSPPATEEDIERLLGGGWSFGLFIPQRPRPTCANGPAADDDRTRGSDDSQPSEPETESDTEPSPAPESPPAHRRSGSYRVRDYPLATEEEVEQDGTGVSLCLWIPQRPTPEAVDASDSGLSNESPSPDDASTES